MAPSECCDLTPAQLASFYEAVGGDYDPLFIGTPPASVAFIYKSLGCRHSLQPAGTDDDFATPSIPALKPKGFVTWQTIQLLLYPEEHMPFIQKAVTDFDIRDPKTGQVFPKLLPTECFPRRPDEQMVAWYEAVSQRLMREAEIEEERKNIEKGKRYPKATGSKNRREPAEKDIGTHSHPHSRYEKSEARTSKDKSHKPRQPFEFVEEKGRVVASTVKHFWDHHPRSHRGSYPRYATTGSSSHGGNAASRSPRGRSRPSHMRRHSTSSTRSSSAEHDAYPRRGHSQEPRTRRRQSHEPPLAPRYDGNLHFPETLKPFDNSPAGSRNSSSGPNNDPRYNRRSMPAQAAQNLHNERRGPLPNLSSYSRPPVVTYTRADFDPPNTKRGRRLSPSYVETMPQPVGQQAEFSDFSPGLAPNKERPPMKPYSYTSPPVNGTRETQSNMNTSQRH